MPEELNPFASCCLITACSVALVPLYINFGAVLLQGVGHSMGHVAGVDAFYNSFWPGTLVVGAGQGLFQACCPTRDSSNDSCGTDCVKYIGRLALGMAETAAGAALSVAIVNNTAMSGGAAQAALSGAVGALGIVGLVLGTAVGVSVVGGTFYCLYKTNEGILGCVNSNGDRVNLNNFPQVGVGETLTDAHVQAALGALDSTSAPKTQTMSNRT